MGAGILPVALYKGSLFILLGQERYNCLWSDFGGGSKNGEDQFRTAIREGTEELNGYLGDFNEIEYNLKKNLIISYQNDRYTSYLFKYPYSYCLPIYFNKNNRFLEKSLSQNIIQGDNGLFEKTKIKWFSVNQLKKINTKNIIRPHYYEIIKYICNNEELIIKKINDIN